MDAASAAEGAAAVRPGADADLGSRPVGDRLRHHQVLRSGLGEAGRDLGRPPGRHQEHLRPTGDPRGGEAEIGRRRGRPVRVRGGLPPDPGGPGEAGRHLPGHRFRAAGAPGDVREVLRLGHSLGRQQVLRAEHGGVVRRVVRLRAAGRARADPVAGLLPDQHREHGPVRADVDHRGRGRLRALRGGLHGADLQVGLAALRRRRDHRARRVAGAATRPSRTGRTTSTTWSPSGPRPKRARPWSGSTATSARRSR